MSLTTESINQAADTAILAIAGAINLEDLKLVKIDFVGDRSELAKANRELGKLDGVDRAHFGKFIGIARARVNHCFQDREVILAAERDERILQEEKVDVTLPGRRSSRGGLHPLTLLTNEISDLFLGLGYRVAEGPELESEWLNFDALNMPADHPARTMQDTFFVEPLSAKLVLRTHTSPVQMRTMLTQKPPIYIICPGRTYRADELDATHTPVFEQVEGLVVDRGITMGHLAGCLEQFTKAFFGDGFTSRLRPSYFPFTEPSAEFDVQRPDGSWLELGGCGMVHPTVLRNCGIDPDEFSGFAFGFGIDRFAIIHNQVPDIRDLFTNDVRVLEQFV